MCFSIVKIEQQPNGSMLEIRWHFDMYIAQFSKTKDDGVNIEYHWVYEAISLQSVMKWVNKVKREPLPYKYYESGTFAYPHNNGFGNQNKGKRMEHIEYHD